MFLVLDYVDEFDVYLGFWCRDVLVYGWVGMECRLMLGLCGMEIINFDLNIRFVWFGVVCVVYMLWVCE